MPFTAGLNPSFAGLHHVGSLAQITVNGGANPLGQDLWSGLDHWDGGPGTPDPTDLYDLDWVATFALVGATWHFGIVRATHSGGAMVGTPYCTGGDSEVSGSVLDGYYNDGSLAGRPAYAGGVSPLDTGPDGINVGAGWLVNPDPPTYPDIDAGDNPCNSLLWTPDQLAALTLRTIFHGGSVTHMDEGNGGLVIRAYALDHVPVAEPSRVMCVL